MDQHPKSKVFRYRKGVPEHLRPYLPQPHTNKRELVRSLETKDRRDADRLHIQVSAEMELILDRARALYEKAQSHHGKSQNPAAPASTTLSTTLNPARKKWLEVVAAITADDDDFEAPIIDPYTMDRIEPGQPPSWPVEPEQTSHAAEDSAPPQESGTSIRDVLKAYFLERKPVARTQTDWLNAWTQLTESVGITLDSPISVVTKTDIRKFKDALLHYPAIRSAIKTADGKRAKDLGFNEIVKYAQEHELRPIHLKTVKGHITALSTVLNYAVSNDYIVANPAQGIKVVVEKATKPRLPLDKNDIEAMLRNPAFSEAQWNHWQWLPILGLLTGCRLEELCQLRIEDLKKDGDIHYLAIRDTDDSGNVVGTLKTHTSQRNIPLHKDLIDMGFVVYVDERRKAGDNSPYIFNELREFRGNRSHYFSKQWNRIRKTHFGIQDSRKTFHSTRHSFRDACRLVISDEEARDALTGHANTSVGRTYGNGFPVSKLGEYISKINYGVKFPKPQNPKPKKVE